MVGIAPANNERRNDFGVRVQRNERPDIADANNHGLLSRGPLLLFANESPNLIHFDIAAVQTAHLGVKNTSASLPNAHPQAHDRIAVNPGNALNASDAVPLAK